MRKFSRDGYSWKMSPLVIALLSALPGATVWAEVMPAATQEIAKNVEFDPSFLNLANNTSVDLTRFANGASALPGVYRTAVYVNKQLISNEEIKFIAREDKTVFPCLTPSLLKNIPFNYEKLPANALSAGVAGQECVDLEKQLPETQISFDSGEQRLDITIPQIYINKLARGSVSPALWDSGVPAAFVGYNLNGYNNRSRGTSTNSFYAGLNAGLNIGAWYLRHNGSYNWMDNGPKQYNTINTYLQRDIPALQGRVLMGQSNTQGQVFDTLPFSGIQLASDERMLPESQRGYAPDIHGIARTNARVTVKQSGQTIYETTVTPGEFLINDLYPTGYGGNLEVTVHEADGSEQTFLVPYASVAQLLRPGSSRYSVTLGEARNENIRGKPALYQAVYQRGLTNAITGYGGVQASQNYYALQLGVALGTPIGALAFDATQARTHLGKNSDESGRVQSGNTLSGQSYQISYSKAISETNSNLSLAAYRFSTNGYMDYMTAMQTRDAVADGLNPDTVWRAKNRFTVTAGQGLPDNWGQFYASGSVQNYWNKEGSDSQFQVGYNNSYKRLTYGLTMSRSFSNYGRAQNNYLLSFSMPLGRADSVHTPQVRLDLSHDNNGRYGEQATISGTGGANNQYSYGVTAMNANQGTGSSGSVNGQYRSQMTSMNATYSAGKHYQGASMGLTGTVIAHPGGITLTPYTSETMAIVEAKGAAGAAVSSYPGVYVDRFGYAAVPYMNPYALNEVSIDPKGMSNDVELENTSQKVAPYSGAVVMLKYNTRRGTPVLVTSTLNGEPVPFGANVVDSKGNSVGSVGQGGQIYARVDKDQGKLSVKWGEAADQQCSLSYHLPVKSKTEAAQSITRLNAVCEETVSPVSQGAGQMAQSNHDATPYG
ncbi:pilus assembly protein PapC [[Pantoea] beijingensis]|uniref:Pilus assembly protein PapC n=1 Tax=[Pantoea] beijingensis TaxID=1324864 RepID=A0A443IAJ7_9GAMM|nr:pilus assembly protein PapC [[Pantoea] beijingensis]